MGLDIAFNRTKAIAAGLDIFSQQRGSDQAIKDSELHDDAEYMQWLKSTVEYVKVPNTDLLVENDGVDQIVVRANKWGRVYDPLTIWLTLNSIPWTEG